MSDVHRAFCLGMYLIVHKFTHPPIFLRYVFVAKMKNGFRKIMKFGPCADKRPGTTS